MMLSIWGRAVVLSFTATGYCRSFSLRDLKPPPGIQYEHVAGVRPSSLKASGQSSGSTFQQLHGYRGAKSEPQVSCCYPGSTSTTSRRLWLSKHYQYHRLWNPVCHAGALGRPAYHDDRRHGEFRHVGGSEDFSLRGLLRRRNSSGCMRLRSAAGARISIRTCQPGAAHVHQIRRRRDRHRSHGILQTSQSGISPSGSSRSVLRTRPTGRAITSPPG